MKFTEESHIEFHPSVLLAWLIGNREAALANCSCVTPPHVLLGALKILDDSYDREAHAFKLNEQDLSKIGEMVQVARPLL